MMPRFVRLLPGVVVLGAGLLVLNATGLVHEAYAQASGAAAALPADPAPANKDYAGADDQVASAAQVDVMNSFAKRRVEMDAREAQLNSQANLLAAAESRVDAKIAQLKTLQDQIGKLLVQRDAEQDKQVASLVKTYSAMKPADAARIFDNLPDEVLVPVAQQMKSDVLALVLGKMNADAAQKLTVKLASRLALPADAAAALPAAAQPVPAPAASAAAAPGAPADKSASAAPAAAAKTDDKPKT
jgi:flagellar motility protein MotE (MotC chaperone)